MTTTTTIVAASQHNRAISVPQETVPTRLCCLAGTTTPSTVPTREHGRGQGTRCVAGLVPYTAILPCSRVDAAMMPGPSADWKGSPYDVAGMTSIHTPAFTRRPACQPQAIPDAPHIDYQTAFSLLSRQGVRGYRTTATAGEAVISDWSAYRVRHMSSVTGNSSVKCITAMEGQPMPTRPRLATRAVEESIDTQVATRRVTQIMTEAMADGVVTLDEARAMLAAARQAEIEADEAAQAAEHADISELLAVAHLTGEHSPRLLSRAQAAGLPVVMVSPNLPRQSDDDDHPRAA